MILESCFCLGLDKQVFKGSKVFLEKRKLLQNEKRYNLVSNMKKKKGKKPNQNYILMLDVYKGQDILYIVKTGSVQICL